MKKNTLLLLSPLALCLPLMGGFVAYQKSALGVYAASGYANAPLPTEINLNPVSETDIRSYYSALSGKDLSGENLLKALKPILKEGQQYHSYDQGSSTSNSIWKAYEITDRDWTLSPAGSDTVGTYNPSTGIISGYKYGQTGNDPYQHLYYRNPGVEAGYQTAWGHHGDNNGTDREHIWPKGHGFGESGKEGAVPGARGDLHHLVAADSYVNSSTHNAYSYGFVDPKKIDDDAGAAFKIDGTVVVAGNYRGTSQTLGSGIVFEPQDCDKGDIARACFYMVARYNNLAGDDTSIDSGNPNLVLSDIVAGKETFISTASKPGEYGILRDLLAWHKLDPVDEYEIHRNDLIYRNYDHNRNPFIDFPDWVDAIWGTVTLGEDNRTITGRDATPKGKANPGTDTVYAGQGEYVPPVGPSSSSESSSSSVDPSPSQPTSFNIPTWAIYAAIGVGALIVIILIVVAVKGKGKSKKTARKILNNAVKGSSKGSSSKSTSSKKKSSSSRKK